MRRDPDIDCRATVNGGTRIAASGRMESGDRLRYVDAERLDSVAGRLNGTVLVSPSGETLGALDGVVIDPIQRHVCYFILLQSFHGFRTHRYLLPATPCCLDTKRKALHVDIHSDELGGLDQCRRDSFPPYSDADLISAMFSTPAA